MANISLDSALKKLDRMIGLLENLLIIELSRMRLSQPAIAKRLGVATIKVNKILKDIKKEK